MTTKKIPARETTDGPVRPIIEEIKPELSGGRFPVKRILNESLGVDATLFIDGHDQIACELLYRHEDEKTWHTAPMSPAKQKDHWVGSFTPTKLGIYHYSVRAWIDRFGTWQHELQKKHEAGQDISIELLAGLPIFRKAAKVAAGKDRKTLLSLIRILSSEPAKQGIRAVLDPKLAALMQRYPDYANSTSYDRALSASIDPPYAGFSAWYEFFPRSTAGDGITHGTFRDAEKWLPYVASMGFDVVYLPPIHPIGSAHRKGKNNSLEASPRDPGSPWGIGAREGGHKAIHPELGTLSDFRRFTKKASRLGLEIALDIAFQCSPDHPYVKKHPEWFKHRPDGSIQYAENPPKKYQDIYPFDFESASWPELWEELKSVIEFWIQQGVRIFRVDNPHTKSFRFWKWAIQEIKREHPEAIFLAEAFTRPAVMYHLAKIGFSQSYTYFTWRNTKAEFEKYMNELTRTEIAEFYRPNFWPNTPDILPPHLQKGLKSAFITRVALAGTLSSNYGIYGPAYELLEHKPLRPGTEEYLDSEKYELKAWNLRSKDSIKGFIRQLNGIRRKNSALWSNRNVHFHPVSNDQILCYSKHTDDRSNVIVVLANLDFEHRQAGVATLPLELFGLDPRKPYQVHDLLNGTRISRKGSNLRINLDPRKEPVRILRIR